MTDLSPTNRISPKIVKSKTSTDLYEVDYLVHGLAGDVFSGHRLSAYDGMPIGGRVWILASEVY